MSLIRNWGTIGVLVLTLTAACQKQVSLDPRDSDLEEQIIRISREVLFHITSDYWGPVRVSILADGRGNPTRLATINFGSNERTFKVSKARLGSRNLALLLSPIGARFGDVRDDFGTPAGGHGYQFIVRGIMIGPTTEHVWLNIRSQLSQSSVQWR